MRSLLTLALFVALGVAPTTAADPEAPYVRAYAVNINHPPKEASREIVSNEYTGVHLFAHLPGKQIVAVDPAASKLTVTDDKNADLIPNLKLNPGVPTDKTKAQGRFYIFGSKAPSAGATRIRVKGELVFLYGVGEKTATVEKLPVKAGEKAEAGPAALEVVPAKDRFVLNVRAASPLVKSVTLIDAAGKPVVVPGLISFVVSDGKVAQDGNFTIPAKTESIGIKVVHYEKVEAVKVVVDSETGVGP
jgi:hypothetical protein